MQAHIFIYALTHGPSGRVYVGQTTDLNKRFAQHRSHPPKRMRADAATSKPFSQHFNMVTLQVCANPVDANDAEQAHIARLQTCGNNGYNNLRANPAGTRKYYFLKRRGLI